MARITYRDAGVDIDAGDELVERIKPLAARTRIPEVVSDVGGFAGLCSVPAGIVDPILVSGTDGVGTKLKIAFLTGKHDTIGIDLVAMCVNDVITTSARPLFFLDYFASGKLDVGVATHVVEGIANGCLQSRCALLGGETAGLPGMYAPGEYDLAGFAVGIVGRSQIVDGSAISDGDTVIGVLSNGLHSNGYSLARRVLLEHAGIGIDEKLEALGETPGEALLRPTRIYTRAVRAASEVGGVRGMCHITGGGLPGNLPRILPPDFAIDLNDNSWSRTPIFDLIADAGNVADEEMRRTFNMGLGFVFVVDPASASDVVRALDRTEERAAIVGVV